MTKLLSILFILFLLVSCKDPESTVADKEIPKEKKLEPVKTFKLAPKEDYKSKKKDVFRYACTGNELESIIQKAYAKDLRSFEMDSFFNYVTLEEVLSKKRELTKAEFHCLGMQFLKKKYYQYDFHENREVYIQLEDSLTYYEYGYCIYSVHFDEKGNLMFFTAYNRYGGDSSHAIRLFTISPLTKKIVDVMDIGFAVSDMGLTITKKSYFVNNRIFVREEGIYEHQWRKNRPNEKEAVCLSKTSFRIDSLGIIKFMGREIVLDTWGNNNN